jgi:hypothetical protein
MRLKTQCEECKRILNARSMQFYKGRNLCRSCVLGYNSPKPKKIKKDVPRTNNKLS